MQILMYDKRECEKNHYHTLPVEMFLLCVLLYLATSLSTSSTFLDGSAVMGSSVGSKC